MKMNQKMRDLVDESAERREEEVPKGLKAILESRFIAQNGCIFLEALYKKKGNASAKSFPDETGYECFVNHVHLEDHGSKEPLVTALAGVAVVGKNWKKSRLQGTLRVIVSLADESCVLRFHRVRPGQHWLSDIDSYPEEALLVEDFRNQGKRKRARLQRKAS